MLKAVGCNDVSALTATWTSKLLVHKVQRPERITTVWRTLGG